MMRPSGVLTRFIVSSDYQVSDKHTTEKEFLSESIGSADRLSVGRPGRLALCKREGEG